MNGVAAAAAAISTQSNGSKYIQTLQANAATGAITVTFDAATTGLPAAQMVVFNPGVKTRAGVAEALANGLANSVEWGCSSVTRLKALGVVTGAPPGTVPTLYAPSECR